MAFVERLIYTTIADGIAALVRDPAQLELIFVQDGLDRSEAQALRELFVKLPPSIIHNYPRQDSAFPLYAIVLGDEKEAASPSGQFLDDSGGLLSLSEAQMLGIPSAENSEIRTSIYTHEYHIWVCTTDPDVTIAYYEIAKYLLTRRREFMKDAGLLVTHFGGGDYAPDARYLPEYLFIRRLSMTCQREARVIDVDNRDDPIHSVGGIFVDDGSSLERLGGVTARVEVPESE